MTENIPESSKEPVINLKSNFIEPNIVEQLEHQEGASEYRNNYSKTSRTPEIDLVKQEVLFEKDQSKQTINNQHSLFQDNASKNSCETKDLVPIPKISKDKQQLNSEKINSSSISKPHKSVAQVPLTTTQRQQNKEVSSKTLQKNSSFAEKPKNVKKEESTSWDNWEDDWENISSVTSSPVQPKIKHKTSTNDQDCAQSSFRQHVRKSSSNSHVSIDSDWSADWEVKPETKQSNDSGFKTSNKPNLSYSSQQQPSVSTSTERPPYSTSFVRASRPSQQSSGSWFSDVTSAAKAAASTTMTHASRNWSFNPVGLLDTVGM